MIETAALHPPQIDFQGRYLDLLKQALCASLYDESAWRVVEGPMRQHGRSLGAWAKHGVLNEIRKQGFLLVRPNPFVASDRESGLDWPLFGYTMTGRRRLDALEKLINQVLDDRIPGDIVETGVWRGGSMMLAAAILDMRGDTERAIWLADSFEGMPVPTEQDPSKSADEDFSDRDYLSASLESVQGYFARFGLMSGRLNFLKGWFCDTLPEAPIDRIAVLRLDGDLYESTRDALVSLYHKVSIGGFVIVDDYNSWPGCKLAVDEFRQKHGVTAALTKIDRDAVYWKVG